jgi:hypothetical protein
LEDPGVDGRIILRWIFRKGDVRTWTEAACFRIGTDGGHINEVTNLRVSQLAGIFHDKLRNC